MEVPNSLKKSFVALYRLALNPHVLFFIATETNSIKLVKTMKISFFTKTILTPNGCGSVFSDQQVVAAIDQVPVLWNNTIWPCRILIYKYLIFYQKQDMFYKYETCLNNESISVLTIVAFQLSNANLKTSTLNNTCNKLRTARTEAILHISIYLSLQAYQKFIMAFWVDILSMLGIIILTPCNTLICTSCKNDDWSFSVICLCDR